MTTNRLNYLQLLVNVKCGPEEDGLKTRFQKMLNSTLWLVGTARNAILVVVTGSITYMLHSSGQNEFLLIGDIPPGLPSIQIPPFSISELRNETTDEVLQKGESFSEMVQNMGSFLIVIPLIALLENISICKAFGKHTIINLCNYLFHISILVSRKLQL